MPKCQWRERPSDDALCRMLAGAGEEFCPRHAFLEGLRRQKQDAKEANRAEAAQLGVDFGLPKTRAGLIRAGYVFTGTGECRGCGQRVEWWQTPRQHKAPFNHMQHPDSHATSHFATCTRANAFRRSA